jgi:cytochrome c-type biogenesis protein CcmH/NrfG
MFSLLVLAGIGTWLQILAPKTRSGPPGSPSPPPPAAGAAAGGGELPEGHPPLEQLAIPDDVKTFITDLVGTAQAQPNDIALWTRLSQVQYRAAQIDSSYYPAALQAFQHVLELEPDNPDAVRGVANVHYDLGDYQKALPSFERYLTLRPDDPGARTDLATVRLHVGDVDRAIAEYREVIAANPSFVQAHYNLGIALHQGGRHDEALAAFRRAREVATDDRIRARVDQIIAQMESPAGTTPVAASAGPAGSTATGSAAAPAATAGGGNAFQERVERFFRTHEIVGPKVVRVEWPAPESARVVVKDFPMTAMPPFARTKFTSRITETLGEAKAAGGIAGSVQVEIVDGATGTVMETVTE